MTISYTSHFVPSRLDILFSFYNWFCDQVCCLIVLSVELVKEQIICTKFCFKVWKTVEETHIMCEAYGDDATS
jgi:hypothetical protein